MQPELHSIVNQTAPCILDRDAPTDLFYGLTRNGREGRLRTLEDIVYAPPESFADLAEARASIVGKFASMPQYDESAPLVKALAERTFDTICAAYDLPANEADIVSVYIFLSCAEIRFTNSAKYGSLHYEHPGIISKPGFYPTSHFVVSSSLFGTDYTSPEELSFEDYARCVTQRRVPHAPTIRATPSCAWSRVSGYVPHAGPTIPATIEETVAHFAGTPQAELVELATRENYMWRILAHGGVRFKDHSFEMGGNGVVENAGSGIAPETLHVLAPDYYSRFKAA